MQRNWSFILCFLLLIVGFSSTGLGLHTDKKNDYEKITARIGALPKDESSPTGYYIPKDLEDAFLILDKVLSPELIKEIKNKRERELITYVPSLAEWIRRIWINPYYRKDSPSSPLTEYFLSFGKELDADDISMIIISTYWCRLNGKPLRLNDKLNGCDLSHKQKKVPVGLVSPIDGAEIFFLRRQVTPCEGKQEYVDIEGVGKLPVACGPTIHLGISKSDGTIWAYQYGKGLYEPSEELKKELKEDTKNLHLKELMDLKERGVILK
jgi:hypothetical protein